MKKLTLSIVILTVAIFICSNVKSQNSNLANLDEFIIFVMEVFHVPGLSACIIKGDSVVWNNNYGFMTMDVADSIPVNDSTLFNVWSISKSLTAACVMQLWDKQLLGLDQKINDYIPFQIINPWTNSDSISARMLLSHSSGISGGSLTTNYITIGDPTIALDYFLENSFSIGGSYYSTINFYNMIPGTQFHYDNIAPGLNGYLVEPLTGFSFNQYAKDSLLTPLDMNTSAWFLSELNMNNLATGYSYSGVAQPHYGHPAYPGISLRTTALELSNFTIMLLNQGIYKGLEILSAASIDSMTTVQNPDWGNQYGITGLGLLERDNFGDRVVWGHPGGGPASGGGYSGHFYFCKEENTGIVILNNSNDFVNPIVLQLFEYAGLFVNADTASQISDSSFYANWQTASTGTGYLLDVAYDEQFTNFVSGLENHDVGLDTNYYISGLNSNTDYFYRVRAYNSTDTGAYSNLINLTTLEGVGINESLNDEINIWSSGKKVFIELSEHHKTDATVQIYTILGKCIFSSGLRKGTNSIPVHCGGQLLFVKLTMENRNIIKKVLVW